MTLGDLDPGFFFVEAPEIAAIRVSRDNAAADADTDATEFAKFAGRLANQRSQ